MRRIFFLGLAALAVATLTWQGGARSALALDPGPTQIGLLQPAVAGCPVGGEVSIPPGPVSGLPGATGSPGVALFIPPGPVGVRCAPGVALMADPGPSQTPGMTFGLPLNAADCADGTAALNGILVAMGGTPAPGTGPGSGPPAGPGSDPCTDGTTAAQGIQNAINAVWLDPGPVNCPQGTIRAVDPGPVNRTTFVLADAGPVNCPQGTALLIRQDAAGTARGFLALLLPPNPNSPASLQFFRITPSAVAGESLVR